MSSFVDRAVFEKKAEEERILSWKELDVDGAIWRIDKIKEYTGKYGRAAVLSIVNEGNVKKCVRITQRMLDVIDEKKETDKKLYFKTFGQIDNGGKSVNEFELVCL